MIAGGVWWQDTVSSDRKQWRILLYGKIKNMANKGEVNKYALIQNLEKIRGQWKSVENPPMSRTANFQVGDPIDVVKPLKEALVNVSTSIYNRNSCRKLFQ